MAAQIYRENLFINTYEQATTNTNVYNLLKKYNDKFTYDSTNNLIVFNNLFKFSFSQGGSWSYGYVIIYDMEGTQKLSSTDKLYRDSYNCEVEVIVMEHSILLHNTSWTHGSTSSYGPFWFFIHEITSTKAYVGFTSGTGNPPFDSPNGIAYFNGASCLTTNSFQTICNVQLASPYILFSTNYIITSSSGAFNILEDFRSCSLVPYSATISINNKNYYAIGTHTLIEVPVAQN